MSCAHRAILTRSSRGKGNFPRAFISCPALVHKAIVTLEGKGGRGGSCKVLWLMLERKLQCIKMGSFLIPQPHSWGHVWHGGTLVSICPDPHRIRVQCYWPQMARLKRQSKEGFCWLPAGRYLCHLMRKMSGRSTKKPFLFQPSLQAAGVALPVDASFSLQRSESL